MKVRLEEVWELDSDASPLAFEPESKALDGVTDGGGLKLDNRLSLDFRAGLEHSSHFKATEIVDLLR